MTVFVQLLTVAAFTLALAYGAVLTLVSSVQPQQRPVLEAANVPAGAELLTGRSVAIVPGTGDAAPAARR